MRLLALSYCVIAGMALLLLGFALPARAEITGAESVEWLTYTADVIAVGKITRIKTFKGPGSVFYEDCIFRVDRLIKLSLSVGRGVQAPVGDWGKPRQPGLLRFTYRSLATDGRAHTSARTWERGKAEMLLFLSQSRDHGSEKHLDGALVPTSLQSPLSLINLAKPESDIYDIDFKVLKDRDAVLHAMTRARRAIADYRNANRGKQAAKDWKYFLKGPRDAESRVLLTPNPLYLVVPGFLSKEARPTIL